uniref:Uncharacterized protein n=1 Tax=Oryza barthii TaxID=65489 RepID=A0A0D3G7R5_9ORYZ
MTGRRPSGGGSSRALPSVGSSWRGSGRRGGGRRRATGCGGTLPSPGSGGRGGRRWRFELEKGVCAVTALGEFGSDSSRLSLSLFLTWVMLKVPVLFSL